MRSILGALTRLLAAALVAATLRAHAPQDRPQLIVEPPASGVVVTPGQSITVTIRSRTPQPISVLMVIGSNPIETVPAHGPLPAQVRVDIPLQISLGTHTIAAMAGGPGRESLTSDPLEIDVERPDFPLVLKPQGTSIPFEVPGEVVPILLHAMFPDGTAAWATDSTRVTYRSSDPSVARVDGHGVVTSVSPGRTSVTVTYAHSGRRVQTVIPVDVPVPALAASTYALNFAAQPVGSSASQTVTLTNKRPGPLRVIGIDTVGEFSETNDCGTTVQPGAMCTVVITFTPREPGKRPGSLRVAESGNAIPLEIPLTGIGSR